MKTSLKKHLVCLKVEFVFFFLEFFVKKISVLTPSITTLLEYKLNETVNKFLLPGDKFMPEMLVRQPKFTQCLWNIYKK